MHIYITKYIPKLFYCQESGKEDADQGRNRMTGCRPRGRCELGASCWSAWDTRRGLSSDLAAWLRRSSAALRPSQFAKGKLEQESKRIWHKYGHISFQLFLTPFPTSVPTSGFSCLSHTNSWRKCFQPSAPIWLRYSSDNAPLANHETAVAVSFFCLKKNIRIIKRSIKPFHATLHIGKSRKKIITYIKRRGTNDVKQWWVVCTWLSKTISQPSSSQGLSNSGLLF